MDAHQHSYPCHFHLMNRITFMKHFPDKTLLITPHQDACILLANDEQYPY